MRSFLAACILLLASLSLAAQVKIGSLTADITTDPSVVPVGKAVLIIALKDASGRPVTGAKVSALAAMPGMNMGEKEQPAREEGAPGVYRAPAVFAMAGQYQATITANGQKASVQLRTGEASSQGGQVPWIPFAAGAGIVALAGWTLHRMRKTGQSLDFRQGLGRQAWMSLLLLAAALAAAVYAVKNWRRPGAMTPIESQAMEMNTPAPDGTLPVVLGKAESKPFSETVVYSGQAVGYVQQDVVARVSGAIVDMPVYVGDRVAKGQVLARLDTSQIDPEIAMRSAQVDRAQKGVGVAALEHQKALSEAEQARAELAGARGGLAEAQAMLKASEEGRNSAAAETGAAQAEVSASAAEAAAASADREYMTAEFGRMSDLYSKGAVSKDEYQKARADAAKADAMTRQAEERTRKASAAASSAQAMQRKVDAEILAARRKIQTAQAAVESKAAMLKTAQASASAAAARIGQERAMAGEAAAGLRGASVQKSYTVLTAASEGYVTERLISPGQLVLPGQAVLRMAQVAPIRLQANVPEAVLAKIRPGADVTAFVFGSEDRQASLKVTSVSPSVDPSARTGVVEALYDNGDGMFKPGQFVRLEIALGSKAARTVVPGSAIASEPGSDSSSGKAVVWAAEPGLNGSFEARRRQVNVLGRSGSDAAVTGLEPGTRVVLHPSEDIKEGASLAAIEEAASHENPIVSVAEQGFEPSAISVPSGKPVTITFVRRVESTCADAVVFPSLGIKKSLPLNTPVKVTLPAMKRGDMPFSCPMNMYKGVVKVK